MFASIQKELLFVHLFPKRKSILEAKMQVSQPIKMRLIHFHLKQLQSNFCQKFFSKNPHKITWFAANQAVPKILIN